ncbi:MAG: tRNA pseudouridine(55) synthase TruB [Bacillota bacterium]
MKGFINFLKPPGMTSHGAVQYFRKLLRIKKVGHTGTLDPGVAGVLPICLGKATRLAEYVTEMPKKYRTEITLGVSTDSQDAYGMVTYTNDCHHIDYNSFLHVLNKFKGTIQQTPPMVSAVRVNGKHLYELARKGIEINRKPRTIKIHDISVFKVNWELPHPKILFDVTCSKGTYIRTLCADIGDNLGVGAHMSYLIRTVSGPFFIEHSYTCEEITIAVEKQDFSFIHPMTTGIEYMPVIVVDENKRQLIIHGNMISLPHNNYLDDGLYRIETSNKELLAIGRKTSNKNGEINLVPIKVLTAE